jgi:aspartate kinase
MEIIVQKYGGTSVNDEKGREFIIRRAIDLKNKGKKPVIVVSAMGRKGDPYATDSLLSIINKENLDASNRDLDMLMACGEIITTTYISSMLNSAGCKAVAFTGLQAGILTDSNFGNADVLTVDTNRLMEYLEDDYIVVVAGFQGYDEKYNVTTLGRGGSDTTAALLGEALKADEIEIYTDVDGVMTADPRVIEDAKLIDAISYDEIYQLSKNGAKVVAHKAVEIAKRSGRALRIKNTFKYEGEGTLICNENKCYEIIGRESDRLFNAITKIDGISKWEIHFNENLDKELEFLDGLRKREISIDMINFFESKKIFTIKDEDISKLKNLCDELALQYDILSNCSKITLIGHQIHGVPGVMSKIAITLAKDGVKILQTSDSYNMIACLVKEDDGIKAIKSLHKEFNLAQS